jgi:tRNA wybutosine-synthesizing protein 2
MRQTPFELIKQSLSSELPQNMIRTLPEKWEKIGEVVTIKLPDELRPYQEMIGKVYTEILRCKTALNDIGGISGVYREPVVEVIYGPSTTETIHTENGIRYKLDPQKIMFSSGNMTERKRMATISYHTEIVVDLFAGIGYFTLPMAVGSKPKKIFSCEINPVAYQYLCENVMLNHVTAIVQPLFGDNRMIAPKECADRVILGYLEEPAVFLPTALNCLRPQGGILHYHTTAPVEHISSQPFEEVETAAKHLHRVVKLLKVTDVKSYAPGIHHVVVDVRLDE